MILLREEYHGHNSGKTRKFWKDLEYRQVVAVLDTALVLRRLGLSASPLALRTLGVPFDGLCNSRSPTPAAGLGNRQAASVFFFGFL